MPAGTGDESAAAAEAAGEFLFQRGAHRKAGLRDRRASIGAHAGLREAVDFVRPGLGRLAGPAGLDEALAEADRGALLGRR